MRSNQEKPLILFCWECGAGLGHIRALERIATEFDQTKYDTCLVTPENKPYQNNSKIFSKVEYLASPDMLAPDILELNLVSYNANLYGLGLTTAKFTFIRLQIWKQFFAVTKPDLIIADYAPFALMAAKNLGIKSVATGNGFTLPATDISTYPKFANRENPIDDRFVLSEVNQALTLSGFEKITHVPEIFKADIEAPCTLDVMDPFSKVRKQPVFKPLLGGSIKPASQSMSDKIFVYLTNCRAQTHEVILTSLIQLGLPVCMYSLQASEQDRQRTNGTKVSILSEPISFDEIVQEHRLVIHLGSFSLATELLLAGRPQFIIPIDFEKILTAHLLKKLGVAVHHPINDMTSTQRVCSTILTAYGDEKLQQNAARFAIENPLDDWRSGSKAVANSAFNLL